MDFTKSYEYLMDNDHVYKSVTHNEIIELFEGFYTGIIYIGGPWSEYCQAVIPLANMIAKKRGLDCIYSFDPIFENVFHEREDFRDCKSLEVKLNYYYIVEKLGFKSDELVTDTLIPKMHVPLFAAVKNGSCVGYYNPRYVYDNYLHEKGDINNMNKVFQEEFENLISKI